SDMFHQIIDFLNGSSLSKVFANLRQYEGPAMPLLAAMLPQAQQHHDQATGGSPIYEHLPIPNPATPPISTTEGAAEKLEAKVKTKSKRKLVISDSEEEEAAKDYAELEKLISLAEAAVNEPSSFVTPSKTTAANSSQTEDISPSTVEAAQILTGGKLDPSKIFKSHAAIAQRIVQTFVRKRSSKSTPGLDYSDVDFSPIDLISTDCSIPVEKVVPADKGVSAALSNKGKGIADDLSVPQRKQTPQEIAQERLSMLEIDRLQAQDEEERKKRLADLSKSDSEYAKQVAPQTKENMPMSIQRYQAQQAKPMTRGETIKFMRTYIKNISAAYYSSGRTMEWANKFKGGNLIAEYNKIKSAVERSTTSQGVKRSGPTLEPGSPKKMKSTAGPSLGSTPADEVPADTGVSTAASVPADQHVSADKSVPVDTRIPAGPCVSAEDATTTIPVNAPFDKDEPAKESSSLRRSTRKKSVAQKRTTPPSSIPFSTDDSDAAHTVDITFAFDDYDEDDSPHPIITGVHLLGWQAIPSGLQTLIRLYGFVDVLSQKQPLDGIALSLWGDLKIMLDTLEVDFSKLEDGTILYMLVDREYPLEIGVMEQLLDHKLQIEKDPVGNTITIAIQLIKRIKGYLKEANRFH
nr:hypothetical protein [Tanacetum cinerariifolium]